MKKVVDNSKTIVKNKEYQLQSNDISNAIYSCSVNARRLIAYCISNAYRDVVELKDIFQNSDIQKGEKIRFPCMSSEFTFDDFFDRLKIATRGKQQHLQVLKAIEECLKATIKVQTQTEVHEYTWFIESGLNIPQKKIKMTFNPLLYKAITEWYFSTRGYSALSLELLGKLSSIYSMRYYEMALAQMGNKSRNGNEQGKWFFERSVDELKTLFVLHGKYGNRMDNFITKVIENPITELNSKNKDFQIEVVKIKEGRRTVGFRFVCTDLNKKLWKIAKTDSYEDKQTKIEINKLEKDITFYKTKFKKAWAEAAAAVEGQQTLPFFQISKDEMILQEFLKRREDKKNEV